MLERNILLTTGSAPHFSPEADEPVDALELFRVRPLVTSLESEERGYKVWFGPRDSGYDFEKNPKEATNAEKSALEVRSGVLAVVGEQKTVGFPLIVMRAAIMGKTVVFAHTEQHTLDPHYRGLMSEFDNVHSINSENRCAELDEIFPIT